MSGTRDGSYYAGMLEALRDQFGAVDVRLEDGRLVIDGRAYPIVDDVIILLDPSQYPESLKRRCGLSDRPGKDVDADPAREVQFSFGAEWREYPRVLPEHEEEFRLYFDLVDVDALRDCRVCDLGCGIGRWSYFLTGKCRELVLVDFSEAIFVARENLRGTSNAFYFMGDIRRLPFRDRFADLVISLGVLHHLPTDALGEIRRLRRYASQLLVYLYYALDNRPYYFRLCLKLVSALRCVLTRIRHPAARSVIAQALAASVYVPLIALGRALTPLGKSSLVPLYEVYHRRSWEGLCQDVYDRFFTPIEQRFTRKEILTLRDNFAEVVVSDGLPYWHFLCRA